MNLLSELLCRANVIEMKQSVQEVFTMFHQVEGLYVDTDVTFAELKGTLVGFAINFTDEIEIQIPAKFFPFY